MKLKLPHRTVNLNNDLPFVNRNELINQILSEEIEFHEQVMTVEEYFTYTWEKNSTKTCMDIIGYYLTKGNAEGIDKEILSHDKAKEMSKGSKRHTTFTGLSKKEATDLGLKDIDDSNYN